jgi:hypothetical protein
MSKEGGETEGVAGQGKVDNPSEEYDEFNAIQMAMSDLNSRPGTSKSQSSGDGKKRATSSAATFDDTDEDEEFSLKDIGSAASEAVGSILDEETAAAARSVVGGNPTGPAQPGPGDFEFDRFDTPTMGMVVGDDGGDTDSVQNAINSILDLPQDERMETPDLNNIAGLLDSMEREQQEQDPATEAAVNSIPRF